MWLFFTPALSRRASGGDNPVAGSAPTLTVGKTRAVFHPQPLAAGQTLSPKDSLTPAVKKFRNILD